MQLLNSSFQEPLLTVDLYFSDRTGAQRRHRLDFLASEVRTLQDFCSGLAAYYPSPIVQITYSLRDLIAKVQHKDILLMNVNDFLCFIRNVQNFARYEVSVHIKLHNDMPEEQLEDLKI